MDIVALFHGLQPYVPSTTWRQLRQIALALLVMTGRVTMLGISRGCVPPSTQGALNKVSRLMMLMVVGASRDIMPKAAF